MFRPVTIMAVRSGKEWDSALCSDRYDDIYIHLPNVGTFTDSARHLRQWADANNVEYFEKTIELQVEIVFGDKISASLPNEEG